jgi:uncharacterized protein
VSQISLLPAAGRIAQPWKNGGGTTIEIAASPPLAGVEAFDWRISTASVSVPGRFSHFGGIDRTLAVITGRLALVLDGRDEPVVLGAASEPYDFPGDVNCLGTPIDGEAIDLNLMVRRGRYAGSIKKVASPRLISIALTAPCTVIVFVDGGGLSWREDALSLRPWDAIRIDDAVGETVALNSRGAVYVVNLERKTCYSSPCSD